MHCADALPIRAYKLILQIPHIAGKLHALRKAQAFSKACAVQMASEALDSAYGEKAQ